MTQPSGIVYKYRDNYFLASTEDSELLKDGKKRAIDLTT